MLKRVIQAREIRMRGKPTWIVRVPQDLRRPGDAKRRFFGADKAAAADFARSLMSARTSLGAEFLKLPAVSQSSVLQALSIVGAENLVKAAAAWVDQPRQQIKTAREAANLFLVSKKHLRKVSYNAYRVPVDHFADHFGDRPMKRVSQEDIQLWVHGQGWQPRTVEGYFKTIRQFFRFCFFRHWIEENPFLTMSVPVAPYKANKILSVADWKCFLETCRRKDPELLGVFCPVLFGGLREAEAQRARAEQFAHGRIDLDDGEQTKLKQRRDIKMLPALAAWLAVPGVKFGRPLNYPKRRAAVIKAAGIKWARNCHRSSFCSYGLELFGAKETARMANHSEDQLQNEYANKIKAKDPKREARKFFNLRPAK